MKLDAIDRQILQILMQDANTSYVDVAKQIHVSAGTIHVRMKNLKRLGVVEGAQLTINHSLLGLDMVAFLGIYLERSSMYPEVLLKIQKIPEVVNVHYTTGPYTMFAQVICKDSQDLYDILHNQIQEIKGVQRTESFISLSESIRRPIQILGEEE
ncbi:Lrp/AsnC ligand binding domain-containing protein [Aureispira sp. CCB-QB1]|uniref:Lrp/AsnC ligand binding domain-containing protein n=2 Tax=unclassified Aureispira TaxID=2649989 RepID=UPI0006972427|nr:Lrp/AsnC ligand binding domain-containing protein [Aureispira sp. CCB-QB1]